MAHPLYAGLDIGSRTTSICVVDDAGAIVREAVCDTDVASIDHELRFLRRRRTARVALETGIGFHLARGLIGRGYSVDVFEARALSKFLRVRRNKTDAGDANGIAQAARLGLTLLPKVHLKSIDAECLSSRLRIRRYLIKARVRAYLMLRSQIELFGGRLRASPRSASFKNSTEAEIGKLFGKGLSPLAGDFRKLLDQVERMKREEAALDRELERLALNNEVCRRLMDIPGVGPICALTFYVAVDEPERFRKSAAIGGYLGLTPRLHQSGLSKKTGRISRMGNREARCLLCHSSTRFMTVTSDRSALHAWAKRIEQRRGKGKSRVALARKLATIMISMWKNHDHYRPKIAEPGPVETDQRRPDPAEIIVRPECARPMAEA